MRNEKGITLIELLVAVAILAMVLIPVLTIMTGTSVRTMENEKASSNLFLAQEVIERVRINTGDYKVDRNEDGSERTYCASKVTGICESYHSFHSDFEDELHLEEENLVFVTVHAMPDHPTFNEVKVVVSHIQKNDTGGFDSTNEVELVTAVKQ